MGSTMSEKILSRATGRSVKAGETIYPDPDLVTVHDWYVVNFDKALKELGVTRLFDPKRVLISTDHEPIALSKEAAARQQAVREIVARYGIEQFFDTGRGGHGHIFPMERGIVRPGMFVLAYDTHVTNYGAVGCLGIPLVTEISEVLACGSVWIRVPETVRVNLHGKLPAGSTVRDLAQKLTTDLSPDLIDYTVVEYGGPAMSSIGFGGRMTLCNTPLEIGAKSALIQPDAMTDEWLKGRATVPYTKVASDPDATFKAVFDISLDHIEPQVAAPPTPDNVVGVGSVEGTPVQHAYIGSCANGSIEDLRDASRILRGRRVHPGVRLLITPATNEIAGFAAKEGLFEIFIEAGACVGVPGCGPCASGRISPMAPDETSINTGTRNDPGRLGQTSGRIYLASPLTVAASAVAGAIADPRKYF
jgi:3-isopropylmalate/(R)-2-methylmalate dehydratase large subunit